MLITSCLPKQVVPNAEIESALNLPQGWIETRTGIRERRITQKGISDLAILSALELLSSKNINPKEIDVVIMSTVTPDHLWPATACFVAHEIGATNAWAFDLSAACSGFLFSLDIACSLILSGRYENILLINGDCMSAIVDPMDKNTRVLFGDGCATSYWTKENVNKIKYLKLGSNGSEYDKICVTNAGSSIRKASVPALVMDGKGTFRLAIETMTRSITELLDSMKLTENDIQWVIPHQANKRIIEAITHNLRFPNRKVLTNLEWVGNTTNASIPLCFHHFQNQFKPGDKIILCAFGAGVTWGAALIEI